jgi:rhodanese-related sulfurtransferase/mannose-6-phosphate isomerase-like protein (cupin superfamily)
MQLTTDQDLLRKPGCLAISAENAAITGLRTPENLADIISLFASSERWMEKVRLRADRRWYERIYRDAEYDIWVISWLPGQSTGFHDHGASAGAFLVATGILEEHRPGQQALAIKPGEPHTFGANYAHDVRNASLAPAISIHAYSPPLNEMNEYELEGDELVLRERVSEEIATHDKRWHLEDQVSGARTGALTIDQVLSAARARLRRMSPEEVYAAIDKNDAILVDIRPESQRVIEGTIPGALVVERNVLEWRFDPASSARLPVATDHDVEVIIFCSEGYTSGLAAAALQDLGLWRATDMVGGFQAWRAAGLPIVGTKA